MNHTILIIGSGRIGSRLTRDLIDNFGDKSIKIYVNDIVKERATKLCEYKPDSISAIKWKNSKDTPSDVDLIILCVDSDSEKKLVDRVVLSKKNFITLSDDNTVIKQYNKYEDTLLENNVSAILGVGLFPGVGNALAKHVAQNFDVVHDVIIERLGFVSNASLSSIKKARKDAPLGVRNTQITESKRKNAKAYSWFPPPYGLLETQAVSVGVEQLAKQFKNARNISVRYTEPKLPTFKERVRHLILREQLTSKNACIKVQISGKIGEEIETRVMCVKGHALSIVTMTAFEVIKEFLSYKTPTPGIGLCSDYIEAKNLFLKLHDKNINFYNFNRC